MRVVAGFLAHEVGDDDCLAVGAASGAQQLLHPGIVADAAVDDDLSRRDFACDRGACLEQMRVLVRVAQNARDFRAPAADLLGDITVEVLGSHNADGSRGPRQKRRCQQGRKGHQKCEPFHQSGPQDRLDGHLN